MDEKIMRPCDVFLRSQGHLLGEYGFVADPGCVQYTVNEEIVLYHYTRPEHLNKVLVDGLQARLPVVLADEIPNLCNRYLVEVFLEPLPQWLTSSPYFGNLGLEFMQTYVGNILLEITLPLMDSEVYVADAAHIFECKHQNRRGRSALRLGYDCRSVQEVCQAEVNSYIPVSSYQGGHIAPNVKITRQGAGIAVLPQYIAVCDRQPLVS
jgi:hypothetical protein